MKGTYLSHGGYERVNRQQAARRRPRNWYLILLCAMPVAYVLAFIVLWTIQGFAVALQTIGAALSLHCHVAAGCM